MVNANNRPNGRRQARVAHQPSRSERALNDFVRSLSDVLVDITALEVNTMVVGRITGKKFVAWDTYRELFQIDETWHHNDAIHHSLRDRYVALRKDLELEYILLICDPNSELFDPTTQERGLAQEERLRILKDTDTSLTVTNSQLPNPLQVHNTDELQRVQQLLDNGRFSRILRKMSELKAGLDNRNRALMQVQDLNPGTSTTQHEAAVKTDLIYAQTVIQLDGDIINRYSQEVLTHPQRDLILNIHKESVTAGEAQWRGLLGFVLELAQKMAGQVSTALVGRIGR